MGPHSCSLRGCETPHEPCDCENCEECHGTHTNTRAPVKDCWRCIERQEAIEEDENTDAV